MKQKPKASKDKDTSKDKDVARAADENGEGGEANDKKGAKNSQKKFKSWISQHFETIEINGASKRRCRCESCGKVYSFTSSHVNLRRHWSVKHGQPSALAKSAFAFHKEPWNDCLIKLVLDCGLPYGIVDCFSFKNFIRCLNPSKNTISRKTLSDIINQKLKDIRIMIVKKLDKATSVALTNNVNACKEDSLAFSTLSAHFLDDEMNLKSVVLDFTIFTAKQEQLAVCDFIQAAIKDFKIGKKVITVTTDNNPYNVINITTLEERLNLRANFGFQTIHLLCGTNVVDLGVKNALKHLESIINTMKTFIETISQSDKRSEILSPDEQVMIDDLARKARQISLEPSGPNSGVEVSKSNSAAIQLFQGIFELRECIDKALIAVPELNEFVNLDWPSIENLIEFLAPFKQFSDRLADPTYSRVSILSGSLPILLRHVERFSRSRSFSAAAKLLRTELVEYARHLDNDIAVVSTLLDPRIKLSFLSQDAHNITKEKLRRLIDIVKTHIQEQASSKKSISQQQTSTSLAVRNESILDAMFIATGQDEVDEYLESPRVAHEIDVFNFWQANKITYPNLYRLARAVLCAQPTSNPTDCQVSIPRLLENSKGKAMSFASIRSNVLINSWLSYMELLKEKSAQ